MIAEFEELPDGRFTIVLRGLVKFRVTAEDNSRPYRLAQVTSIPEVLSEADKSEVHTQRLRLQELIEKGGVSRVSEETTDEELINMVAQYLPMDHARRQQLLEMESLLPRVRALIELIESKAGTRVD